MTNQLLVDHALTRTLPAARVATTKATHNALAWQRQSRNPMRRLGPRSHSRTMACDILIHEMTENVQQCPLCHATAQRDFFALTLPSNSGRLLRSQAEALNAPEGEIVLAVCDSCGFIQNRCYEPSALSFAPGYDVSLTSSPLFRSFAAKSVERLIQNYDLRKKTVVEVGCGKGEFLRSLCSVGGNDGHGFDPTLERQDSQAEGEGNVTLYPGYFTSEHQHLKPEFLCALGVLDCIPAPLEFLASLRALLGTGACVVYVEVLNAERALRKRAGWSIHYESCNYWTPDSLTYAFSLAGFQVRECAECYADGEYLRIEATPGAPLPSPQSPTTAFRRNIDSLAEHHESTLANWKERLATLHREGDKIAVWGTGGKGTTFLNSLPRQLVDCVIDINPNRQHSYVPGSGHRIEPPEHLLEVRPALVVVTNPIYETEIRSAIGALGLCCDIRSL